MRHSDILMAAIKGAYAVSGTAFSDGEKAGLSALYDYARARKFPPPETLARKHFEIVGDVFPYNAFAEAPEITRIYYTIFRTVAEALEPFREEDGVADPDGVDSRTVSGQAAMDAQTFEHRFGNDSEPPAKTKKKRK